MLPPRVNAQQASAGQTTLKDPRNGTWLFPNLRVERVLHLVWAYKLGFWPVRARHDSLWCPVCHRSRSCDVPALVAVVSELLAG